MNFHRFRLWLALIILVIALLLLAASLLPQARLEQLLPMPPVLLPTPEAGAWFGGMG